MVLFHLSSFMFLLFKINHYLFIPLVLTLQDPDVLLPTPYFLVQLLHQLRVKVSLQLHQQGVYITLTFYAIGQAGHYPVYLLLVPLIYLQYGIYRFHIPAALRCRVIPQYIAAFIAAHVQILLLQVGNGLFGIRYLSNVFTAGLMPLPRKPRLKQAHHRNAKLHTHRLGYSFLVR